LPNEPTRRFVEKGVEGSVVGDNPKTHTLFYWSFSRLNRAENKRYLDVRITYRRIYICDCFEGVEK
jgi:hypothetical protein